MCNPVTGNVSIRVQPGIVTGSPPPICAVTVTYKTAAGESSRAACIPTDGCRRRPADPSGFLVLSTHLRQHRCVFRPPNGTTGVCSLARAGAGIGFLRPYWVRSFPTMRQANCFKLNCKRRDLPGEYANCVLLHRHPDYINAVPRTCMVVDSEPRGCEAAEIAPL